MEWTLALVVFVPFLIAVHVGLAVFACDVVRRMWELMRMWRGSDRRCNVVKCIAIGQRATIIIAVLVVTTDLQLSVFYGGDARTGAALRRSARPRCGRRAGPAHDVRRGSNRGAGRRAGSAGGEPAGLRQLPLEQRPTNLSGRSVSARPRRTLPT